MKKPYPPDPDIPTPIDAGERETIARVLVLLRESGSDPDQRLETAVREAWRALERLAEVVDLYPSPLDNQRLGDRERGLDTLVGALSGATPANFEFHAPTRATVGRALQVAETNFYRLLWHVCGEPALGERGLALRGSAAEQLRSSLYTVLVEDLLISIVSDEGASDRVRRTAVVHLARLWDRRTEFRVRKFFPVIEAAWDARQRIKVTGGTLLGTSEIFSLFLKGCDPRFVEHFSSNPPTSDEVQAFREFLFGASSEELDALADRMAREGVSSIDLDRKTIDAENDAGTMFYEFFRSRFLLAAARRMAGLPGPKRTAEGYLLIAYLEREFEDGADSAG